MRILGIDLGSKSIKAVELDSAFGRYEIHDYHEVARAPGQSNTEAVTQLIQSLAKRPDKISVAVRTSQVTFRNLTLPTRDKKAIHAGVGFELEDELPFSLDDAVYDYSILSQGKQVTQVHVSAILKKQLVPYLSQWEGTGADPDLVTTEAWAYRAFLNRVLPQATPGVAEKPVLLLQMGHERTTLYLHWRGIPLLSREITWGGRDLTAAISQKYQIPLEQAESSKLDHGFIIPTSQQAEVTPEQIEFSDTLKHPLNSLLIALKQAELSCKNLTQQTIDLVYLSGGSSLLPGMAKVLEESISTPVRPLPALSSVAASGVTYSEQTDAVFLLAAALALSQVGTDRASTINFRKGEFTKHGEVREFNFATLRKPLIALGAIAFCFFTSLSVQSRVYHARLDDLDQQLEKSVKSFFGSVSSSAVRTYMSNTSSLRNSINRELTKQRETAKLLGPNPKSPLDFLKELSAAVPKDVTVDMTQYQVGAAPSAPYTATAAGEATLTFLVSNPQIAERLNTLLANKVSGLQRGKMEEATAADGTKRWKVTFSGKPTEDAYGK